MYAPKDFLDILSQVQSPNMASGPLPLSTLLRTSSSTNSGSHHHAGSSSSGSHSTSSTANRNSGSSSSSGAQQSSIPRSSSSSGNLADIVQMASSMSGSVIYTFYANYAKEILKFSVLNMKHGVTIFSNSCIIVFYNKYEPS